MSKFWLLSTSLWFLEYITILLATSKRKDRLNVTSADKLINNLELFYFFVKIVITRLLVVVHSWTVTRFRLASNCFFRKRDLATTVKIRVFNAARYGLSATC